jgi:hypothetical protein
MVRCSSAVRRVWRSGPRSARWAILPTGSMSASAHPPRLLVRRPARHARELGFDVVPIVPEVVRDAPHLGVETEVLEVRQGQHASGREAEYHVPAGFSDGVLIGGNLRGEVRPQHVVRLDEVHAPLREQRQLRIVVCLRPRMVVGQPVIVSVPVADGR